MDFVSLDLGAVPLHSVWHMLDEGKLVIGQNCDHVPRSLHWSNGEDPLPLPRTDGFWGFHEYSVCPQPFDSEFPYLSWIPLSGFSSFSFAARIPTIRVSSSLTDLPTTFCRHPSSPDRGFVDRGLLQVIRDDTFALVEMVKVKIEEYEEHERKRMSYHANATLPTVVPRDFAPLPNPYPDRSSTRFPLFAMQRACAASIALGFEGLLFRDVLEYLAGLKRAIAELHGFLLWHAEKEAVESTTIHRVHAHRSRGAIATNMDDYLTLSRLGLPVWLRITLKPPTSLSVVPHARLIAPPIALSHWSEQLGSRSSSVDIHRGKFVHNKGLEFYPPVVDGSTSFERAARGYAPRLDVFRRDPRTLRALADMIKSLG